MRNHANLPIREIQIHATLTTPEDTPTVRQYVMEQFADGYLKPTHHYCISPTGEIRVGRPEPMPSPVVMPFPNGVLVIVLLGGLDASGNLAFPNSQWQAAVQQIKELRERHADTLKEVAYHPADLATVFTGA